MWQQLLKRILFYWPVKIFAACHVRPYDPHKELNLSNEASFVFILESNSISDLLTLEKLTRKKRFPNPFSTINSDGISLPRTTYLKKVNFFNSFNHQDYPCEQTINDWIKYSVEKNIDLQIIPITILWSRNPGHIGDKEKPQIRSAIRKFFRILFLGYDNITIISKPISIQNIVKHNPNVNHASLLKKIIQTHFERRRKEFIGPQLPNRKEYIAELLNSENIQNAIKQKALENNQSIEAVRHEAHAMLNEIVSNTSYHLLRFIETILHLIWNKLYHGIKVHGAQKVRDLIRTGHEIVYIPCHRSHMDYMLLMYVLFHERLVIPHIAAGNNLNFFPINMFLPRCGAFYMRRKFKGDALYTAVFKEYLCSLFMKGYSTEFYIEGGRSRSGKTLPPRTGIVAMAVQTQLRGIDKTITFVPVYLGYEKVMEVNSYMNELNGEKKQKESAWQLLHIFKRLKYYGRGYVGFGEPISIPSFLKDNVPNWHDDFDPTGQNKPEWLFNTVNELSDEIVKHLNSAAFPNGLNMCALALLSVKNHTLRLDKLEQLLNFYIFLIKNAPLSMQGTLPEVPGIVLLKQALELNSFDIIEQNGEKFAKPQEQQIIYLSYFRNNILHFFALPALITTIILVHNKITYNEIISHTRNVFYFLRHELFCPIKEEILDETIYNYLHALQLEEYIQINNNLYSIGPKDNEPLKILSNCIHSNLVRYIVGFTVMNTSKDYTLSQETFIEQCIKKSKLLPVDITDNSPEFFDPVTFKVMSDTFIKHQYVFINDNNKLRKNPNKLLKLLNAVGPLLPKNILESIEQIEEY